MVSRNGRIVVERMVPVRVATALACPARHTKISSAGVSTAVAAAAAASAATPTTPATAAAATRTALKVTVLPHNLSPAEKLSLPERVHVTVFA